MGEGTVRLAGAAEAAKLLGIDAEIVVDLPGSEALARAGTPFPRPLAELADHGPIWDVADLEAWKAVRRDAWRKAPAGRGVDEP
jgi:hypothetical protein